MLLIIVVIMLLISVSAILTFRKAINDAEKIGFVSGVVSLVSFPFGVVGAFFAAFNLQGIFNNKSGWIIFFYIWIISEIICLICLFQRFVNKTSDS